MKKIVKMILGLPFYVYKINQKIDIIKRKQEEIDIIKRKQEEQLDYLQKLKKHSFYSTYFQKNIKLQIGAGICVFKGWVNTEIEELDLLNISDWKFFDFFDISISNVLAEHVFEHLSFDDCTIAFTHICQYLSEGGVFRIAVPDGFHPSQDYIEYVKPNGYGAGADDHKVLFNYKLLSDLLTNISCIDRNGKKASFKVLPREYYDENKKLITTAYDEIQDGFIARNKAAGKERKQKFDGYDYTSLIVDVIKQVES